MLQLNHIIISFYHMLCPSGAPQRRAFGSFGLTQSCQHSSIRWTPDAVMTWWLDVLMMIPYWQIWLFTCLNIDKNLLWWCLINDMMCDQFDPVSSHFHILIYFIYILDLDSGGLLQDMTNWNLWLLCGQTEFASSAKERLLYIWSHLVVRMAGLQILKDKRVSKTSAL